MNRIASSGVAGCIVLVAALQTGCALRKPFDATVVAAGAEGGKVKLGYFRANDTLPPATEGGAPVSVSVGIDQGTQRPAFTVSDPSVTSIVMEPLHIDDESVGHVVFDLMPQPPANDLSLVLLAWVDVNGDGKLQLSSEGDSEAARTIYRFNSDSNGKAVLSFYNFIANGGDSYYTATALEGNTNVIVTEDFLDDWMAVLPGNTDPPLLGADTDGDGLADGTENRLGTNIFEPDSDFDGEDDPTEVGADPFAPLDADADGLIDAIESDDSDFDADGLSAELDENDNDGCLPEPTGAFCDPDLDGLVNQDETTLGTDPNDADSDDDTLNDLTEAGSTFAPTDTDFDGIHDALESDDDGDGIPTATELADALVSGDVDGDFLPNHRDTDSDGDGALDADEGEADADADGVKAYVDVDELPAP